MSNEIIFHFILSRSNRLVNANMYKCILLVSRAKTYEIPGHFSEGMSPIQNVQS